MNGRSYVLHYMTWRIVRSKKNAQLKELYWLSRTGWSHMLKSRANNQWGKKIYVEDRTLLKSNVGVDW